MLLQVSAECLKRD